MGLTARARHRLGVWNWRLRYWWLDTENGRRANIAAICIGALVVVLQMVRMFVAAALPPPPGEPVKAIYWWVVQLIIAVISAVVAYMMRPKVEPPKPQQANAPTTEDGTSVKHYGGTVWVGDEFLMAWKPLKPVPIKSKGGKK